MTKLFTPTAFGPLNLRNHLVMAPLTRSRATGNIPNELMAEYYGQRATAGLIITEEHSTHPTDWPYEKLIHGFHRDVIPGYRKITDAVHRHRVPVFAQINHNGGQASSMYSRLPVWGPSPVADPLFREVPKAVTEAEIDAFLELVDVAPDSCILDLCCGQGRHLLELARLDAGATDLNHFGSVYYVLWGLALLGGLDQHVVGRAQGIQIRG